MTKKYGHTNTLGVDVAPGVSITADTLEAAREEMADMLLAYLDVLAEAGDLLACLSKQGTEVRAPAGLRNYLKSPLSLWERVRVRARR